MVLFHSFLNKATVRCIVIFSCVFFLHTAAYSNDTDTLDRDYEPIVPWNAGEYILPPHPKINLTITKPAEIPATFDLYQNYPNPFNPVTTIAFDVPQDSHVEIIIYNIMGQQLKTLVDKKFTAGRYEVKWPPITTMAKNSPPAFTFTACRPGSLWS